MPRYTVHILWLTWLRVDSGFIGLWMGKTGYSTLSSRVYHGFLCAYTYQFTKQYFSSADNGFNFKYQASSKSIPNSPCRPFRPPGFHGFLASQHRTRLSYTHMKIEIKNREKNCPK